MNSSPCYVIEANKIDFDFDFDPVWFSGPYYQVVLISILISYVWLLCCRNRWGPYHPYTNILWMHYLCDKLLHSKRYTENDRGHRDALKQLRTAYNNLLDYGSAAHFVSEDELFTS
jgi:hypothetical protein